jgi:hypothetical protein
MAKVEIDSSEKNSRIGLTPLSPEMHGNGLRR